MLSARTPGTVQLKEAKVTVTPGSPFGPTGEHHVRMAFCVSQDVINTAFDRIETYFGEP